MSELTREEQWCRMGLLAGGIIHWVAAVLMMWPHWFPAVAESSSSSDGGSRLAALLAGLLGAA